jgi:glycosyltransferase involved in cell wall biosynthesis
MVLKLPHRTYSILHTESSLGWGGQEHRILAEALAMRQRGHRLALACDPAGELFVKAGQQGFQVTPVAFGGRRNLRAFLTVRRLLQTGAVDVLNSHSSLDSWVAALAWRSLGARPLLVRTRHLSTRVKNDFPTRWLYRTPGAIITTGQVTKELLMARLGVPESHIFSIPTGVNLKEFFPRKTDEEGRARLEIPSGAFVFGCVAVLRSWKGHLYLLEAFKQLLREGREIYLLIVGEGPYREVIAGKIADLALAKWVRLVGYRDRVADWFALMDAVVLASYANEGVPQSLLQALALALPVVGTTVGGIPEVIVPEETGLLVPPKDAAALCRAMGVLMADPAQARELGRRGRALVVERFSLDQMAAEVEAVYEVLSVRSSHQTDQNRKQKTMQ